MVNPRREAPPPGIARRAGRGSPEPLGTGHARAWSYLGAEKPVADLDRFEAGCADTAGVEVLLGCVLTSRRQRRPGDRPSPFSD